MRFIMTFLSSLMANSAARRRRMGHAIYDPGQEHRPAWNAGHKLGAKRPLTPKQAWEIRFWLEREQRLRDRALFDLATDSKLRGLGQHKSCCHVRYGGSGHCSYYL
jgi:hypothetical protein